MIHIGGMDVISLTPYQRFTNELQNIITNSKKICSNQIFIISVNNTGAIPFFRFPLNKIFTRRSREISRICEQVTKENSIVHIPLFKELIDEPLLNSDQHLFSSDKIHPNDEGYKIWYQQIKDRAYSYLTNYKI